MLPAITLRPVTAADEPLLYEVFKHGMGSQFAGLPWPPEAIDHLTRMQYEARTASYRAEFPNSDYSIVLVDGAEAGMLWVQWEPALYRLIDVELLPAFRNRGIGTRMLERLMEEAQAKGVPIGSTVATNNPQSLALHQRLGFRMIEEDQMYWSLEWRPEGAPPADATV